MLFLLGAAFGIALSLTGVGLALVAFDRGWIKPWWRGF